MFYKLIVVSSKCLVNVILDDRVSCPFMSEALEWWSLYMHNISFSKAACKAVPLRWQRRGGGSSKQLHSVFFSSLSHPQARLFCLQSSGLCPVPQGCRGFTAESFCHINVQGACTEPQGKASGFPDVCSAAISKSKDRFFSEENFYGLWNLGEKRDISQNPLQHNSIIFYSTILC